MKDLGKFMKRGYLAQVTHTCGACVFSQKKRGSHLLRVTTAEWNSCEHWESLRAQGSGNTSALYLCLI